MYGIAPISRWIPVAVASFLLAGPAGALDVPLTVRELAGTTRTNEIVTTGVPIPRGELFSDQQASIQGLDGQFRTLATWGDGSVKWLLVSFPASLPAHGSTTVRLVNGGGDAAGGELTVFEGAGFVTVTTGPLKFRMEEDGFNLFDSVWLDTNGDGSFPQSEQIVAPNAANGSIVEDRSGDLFTSAGAPSVKLTVEEAGPLRAVVHFEGTHTGSSGGHLRFSGRVYATRGRSDVKIQYSHANMIPTATGSGGGQPKCRYLQGRGSSGGAVNSLFMEDLSLVTRVNLAGSPQYAIQGNPAASLRTGQLTQEASLYQDSSGGPRWNASVDVSFKGYEMRHGGATLASGNQADGFVDIHDGARGLAIAIRHMWQNFPNKLAVAPDGTVTVGVMPRDFSTPFEHRPGERKTHWTMFYFHGGDESGSADIAAAFHEPLRAMASARWYADSRALDDLGPYDPGAHNAYEVHNRYASTGFRDKRDESDYYGWMHFGDLWSDQSGGEPPSTNKASANLEYDTGFAFIQQALRTSGLDDDLSDRWWRFAEEGNLHTADIDVYHVTEGPLQWMWGGMWNHTYNGRSGWDDPHRGESPNSAHTWNRGMLNWYYVSGDAAVLEAAVKVGEGARFRILNGPGGPGYSNTDGEERAPGHMLQVMLDMYLHTWDESYLTGARKIVHESRPDVYPQYASPHSGDWKTKPWMIAILMRNLGRFAMVMQQERGVPETEAIASLLTRAAFIEDRAWTDRNGGETSYIPYKIRGNGQDEELTTTMWNVRLSDAMTYAARFEPGATAKARYLQIAQHGFEDGSRHPWCGSCPNFEYTSAKTHQVLAASGQEWMIEAAGGSAVDTTPPGRIQDLRADTAATHGEVELSWTAPGDDGSSGRAVSYLVRRAPAEIVTGGDWSAASVVTGAPAPANGGASESMTVTGLPAGEWWFAVRAQDEALNVGAISNSDPAAVTGTDGTPPAPPTKLQAGEFSDGTLQLAWEVSSESDLAGYHVYRRGGDGTTPAHSDWERLNGEIILSAGYLDRTLRAVNSYEYGVTAVDAQGNESEMSQTVKFWAADPSVSLIDSNHPNPFRGRDGTDISFRTADSPGDSVPTSLRVYDVAGRQVRLLYQAAVSPGESHTVHWDGRNDHGQFVAPGVYFYRLWVGSESTSPRRMVVMR